MDIETTLRTTAEHFHQAVCLTGAADLKAKGFGQRLNDTQKEKPTVIFLPGPDASGQLDGFLVPLPIGEPAGIAFPIESENRALPLGQFQSTANSVLTDANTRDVTYGILRGGKPFLIVISGTAVKHILGRHYKAPAGAASRTGLGSDRDPVGPT